MNQTLHNNLHVGTVTEVPDGTLVDFEKLLAGRGDSADWQSPAFHFVLQALPAAVYTTDAAGRITFYNEAAATLWGHRPELGQSEWCGSWRLYWPDGRFLPHHECPMAMALKDGHAIKGMEAAAERPDGTRIPFLAYPTPFKNSAGQIIGAVNMMVDITGRKATELNLRIENAERRRAEEHKDLLLEEMKHRIRNTLSLVASISAQTFHKSGDDERKSFVARLQALASAHDLLTEKSWKSASLKKVVLRTLEVHRAGLGRIDIAGADFDLDAGKAVTLALALHELATNAQKYGALSVSDGIVKIEWAPTPDKPRSILFHWREYNGPPVEPPKRRGFGSRLIERGLATDLESVKLEYPPEGVICSLGISLATGD
ncbi:MAG: PAS domain-containing protein [Rhizobiales bacterium]|nr:PAS domain-containing protein [Hyphomicrobiales bacterium]